MSDTAAGRGRRFKTREAADAYIAHLKEPPTVVPATAALVVTLAFCERGRLVLRPDTTYRFEVMPGCDDCAEQARAEAPDAE